VSGIHCLLVGGSLGLARGNVEYKSPTAGAFTLLANGTASTITLSPQTWHARPFDGIGSAYWVRFARTGGSFGTQIQTSLGGGIVSLSSGLTVFQSGAGNVSGTIEFSRSPSFASVETAGTVFFNNAA
jgi:hypothetical protein